MKTKKGLKTSLLAIAGLLCFVSSLVMFYVGNINMEEFSMIGPSIIAIFGFLIGMYSKDSDKSHSQD